MLDLKAEFKNLLGDSVVYGLSRAATMFTGVILVPIFTRVFRPDEYGVIDVLTVTVFLTIMLLNLGSVEANFIFFLTSKEEEDKRKYASTTLFFRLTVVTLFFAAAFGLSAPISRVLFRTDEHAPLVKIVVLSIPFYVLHSYFLELLRCRFQKWRYTCVAVGTFLSIAVLNIVFVVVLEMGLNGVVFGNFLANAVFTVVGFVLVRSNFSFTFSVRRLKKMLAYGLPLVPSTLSFWLIRSANRFFLVRLASIEDVGIYTVACKLSALIDFVNMAFIMGWAPLCVAVSAKPDIKRFYAKTLVYFSMLTGFLMLAVTTFAHEILSIATTEEYVIAYRVVGPLCFISTGYGLYYISNLGLTLTRKTYHITWCVFVAAVVCIALDWLTIPIWGLYGAAYASVAAFVILNILIFVMSQRYYRIPYEFGKTVLILVGAAGLMAAGTSVTAEPLQTRLLLKLGIIASFPVLLYLLRIFDASERAFIKAALRRCLSLRPSGSTGR